MSVRTEGMMQLQHSSFRTPLSVGDIVALGNGPIKLVCKAQRNLMVGNSSDNEITGRAGADQLAGEEGDDVLIGNGGSDSNRFR